MHRIATFLLLAFLAPLSLADDWPQWRGPARDGVWADARLPERLPADGLPARWRRPLGGGYSGIAVAGGRVYTMDRVKQPEERERVLCLDAATGKEIWKHEYPVSYGKLDYGNGPRATPTVHNGRVYTFGALGHLHCLDARTGKVHWNLDTVERFRGRVPMWGHACSPLLDGDQLVVQVGGTPDACLVALDPRTGTERWRSLTDRPGYSSPVLIGRGEGRQLVYWAAEHLVGMKPDTGEVLWRVPHTTNYDVTISDPVWHNGVLLVSDYWEGSIALRLPEGGKEPEVLWKGRRLSLLMSTPLVRDGHAYALDRHNGLKCIELATGEIKWEGWHVTPRGRNPQASLVWAGDRALIFTSKGELVLARLSPRGYEELSRTPVCGETWAHPAFAVGCVFARTDTEIVCVPLGGPTP